MGADLKQMSKFLGIYFWNFVLDYWELEKRKILKKKNLEKY
jgi:hypothetical protein